MEKTLMIGDSEVVMKATANTPKVYRNFFNRDLIVEMQGLYKTLKNGEITDDTDLSVIENMAYVMAWQHDQSVGTMTEWLDNFGMMDIYNAMNDIISMWIGSSETLSKAKKK